MKPIRTRFSPSPTGMIHMGNARTALFSALFAAKSTGVFILRIEDTDVTRSEEKFVDSLISDLHWLGLEWQEGPGKIGRFGPYWQSQRQDLYLKYFQTLEANKNVYPCFCSDSELLLARKLQLSQGKPPRYAGTCLRLPAEEISARIAAGEKYAWRFSVPKNQVIEFIDVVKGAQSFKSDDIGDFIVRRADGTYPFLFSNAIDDATMQVSHVIRGEDHLANTPRQIMILQALNLPVPTYVHLALIVGEDGTPLSKRHGSFSLHDMRTQGYLPIALLNYLSRLGQTIDSRDLLNFDHLAMLFSLEKLSRSAARFDLNQLLFWQKTAIAALDITSFWEWLGEAVTANIPDDKQAIFAQTIRANIEFPQDALIWSKILFEDQVSIGLEHYPLLKAAGEEYFLEAERTIEKHGTDLPRALEDMKKTLNLSGKKLFMPLRVALTGLTHGPELIQIAQILGSEKMKHRIIAAMQIASKQ